MKTLLGAHQLLPGDCRNPYDWIAAAGGIGIASPPPVPPCRWWQTEKARRRGNKQVVARLADRHPSNPAA
jgi:hypothetical protein